MAGFLQAKFRWHCPNPASCSLQRDRSRGHSDDRPASRGDTFPCALRSVCDQRERFPSRDGGHYRCLIRYTISAHQFEADAKPAKISLGPSRPSLFTSISINEEKMSNRIFDALFRERIDVFRSAFSATSTEVFYDPSQNRLFHTGEYGTYRESIVREFLKFIIPQSFDISTGFVISTMDDVSTQCDVIAFDSRMTPLYQEGDRQRFFPLESVYCVGEVKSKLTRTALSEALNKLAAIKALGERITTPAIAGPNQPLYDPVNNHLQLFPSILICQKFDFVTNRIENEIDGLYDATVEHRHKHNMILSIEDGLLAYNHSSGTKIPYPRFSGQNMRNCFLLPQNDPYYHFKLFGSFMFMLTANKTAWYPEFSNYITLTPGAGIERIQP